MESDFPTKATCRCGKPSCPHPAPTDPPPSVAPNLPYPERVTQAMAQNPAWRYGQAAYNCLPEWLQNEVVGTHRDPFHVAHAVVVGRFISWAEGRIAGEGDGEYSDTPERITTAVETMHSPEPDTTKGSESELSPLAIKQQALQEVHELRAEVERLMRERDQARLIVRGMWGAQTPTSDNVAMWNRAIELCREWGVGTLEFADLGAALGWREA